MNIKKIIYILLGLLIAVGILVGGHKLQEKREYDQMVEIVESKEARAIFRRELKYIDKEACTENGKIQKYKVESFEKNPMGGVIVYLRVNDNENYTVSVFLSKDTGKLDGHVGSWSKDLVRLVKVK
ncbi:DUF1310 domain-containing protein [Streptococcus uberis]|uniref:DUF1310 family protein n=1 Tax=Streptococcus uberis TaxID=1349 RepID=UPI001FF5BF35|nr:DUF1310 family protein [Streptococcus uberis]MCK1211527.1 DUF1310 domain-containing protein [Streptococcus uberis]MCK1217304.1 DUF1310 domain-containing protein [Streptococcus uberis]